MEIQLRAEADIRKNCSAIASELTGIIRSLIPSANIEEIGSTAIPGALTKGDVDLLISVEIPEFEAAKQILERRFEVNEGMEGIEDFASFKGSLAGIEYGVQLATINEREFGFLRFRDLLKQSPDLVQQYNAVKLAACHLSMDEYRAKKNEFIEATLRQDLFSRGEPRTNGSDDNTGKALGSEIPMTYSLRPQLPTVDEYIAIRLAAGLSRKSAEAAKIGLSNSLHSVMVFDAEQPIAIGRIIGDGGCFFQITDIAVLPSHQGKGVGTMIISQLVTWLRANAPSSAYVSLIADHGTPEFYARFGFSRAELPKSCGMYMRIA